MTRMICVIALAWGFSAAIQGQELQEGTWSGTRVRLGQRNNNPQPQRISLEVKKAPDPHVGWRPEKREVLNVTLVAQQARVQVSDLQIDQESLSFSYRQELQVTCRLDRQADGSFEGDCVGEDGRRMRLTLTPPKSSG